MKDEHRSLFGIGFTLSILVSSLYVVHRFIPSILWAAVIAVATYPLYRYWEKLCRGHRNIAATGFTLLLTAIFLVPLSWLIGVLIQESQYFINYLQMLNHNGGGEPPALLREIPWVSDELMSFWQEHIASPGAVRHLLSQLHMSLTPASYYLKEIGVNIVHRSVQVGFTILTLFFFFRDGQCIWQQIQLVGAYCLDDRWALYAQKLPAALRSTVNGTIVVGLGVGFLMGICYALVGLTAPTLTGFVTAFAAMIPFLVPVVFLVVAGILMAAGKLIGAIIVIVWGTCVMFIADHFVKPGLIGGSIALPFLAVLFGILGGLETMGLLGLFLGPIIMVLFITLWQEPQYRLTNRKDA